MPRLHSQTRRTSPRGALQYVASDPELLVTVTTVVVTAALVTAAFRIASFIRRLVTVFFFGIGVAASVSLHHGRGLRVDDAGLFQIGLFLEVEYGVEGRLAERLVFQLIGGDFVTKLDQFLLQQSNIFTLQVPCEIASL